MNFTLLNIYLLQVQVSNAPENKTGGIYEKRKKKTKLLNSSLTKSNFKQFCN